jgi:hypothetical protein
MVNIVAHNFVSSTDEVEAAEIMRSRPIWVTKQNCLKIDEVEAAEIMRSRPIWVTKQNCLKILNNYTRQLWDMMIVSLISIVMVCQECSWYKPI